MIPIGITIHILRTYQSTVIHILSIVSSIVYFSNTQVLPPTMDKATYTRMANENDEEAKSNDKTIIVHSSRHPSPRTPKVILEQPRRHHRRSRKHRSKTLVSERTTRIPRHQNTTYI